MLAHLVATSKFRIFELIFEFEFIPFYGAIPAQHAGVTINMNIDFKGKRGMYLSLSLTLHASSITVILFFLSYLVSPANLLILLSSSPLCLSSLPLFSASLLLSASLPSVSLSSFSYYFFLTIRSLASLSLLSSFSLPSLSLKLLILNSLRHWSRKGDRT